MQVVALKCPNCGNGLSRESARCEYCKTVITISFDQSRAISTGISCPKCNATNGENEKHCGQCGAVLLIECPKQGCLQENSIWRNHCQKCGTAIRESLLAGIEERADKIRENLLHKRSELKQAVSDVESAKGRETAVKMLIGGTGIVISLSIVGSAGTSGIIGGLIVMAIALILATNHKSEEKLLLIELVNHYLIDIEELETEAKTLNGFSSLVETASPPVVN